MNSANDNQNRRRIIYAIVVGCFMTSAAGARAQVFEIGDDGGLHRVIDGPNRTVAPKRPPAPQAGLRAAIQTAAQANGLSPEFLEAVARTESNLDPHAVSPAGAIGVMQLMPATAAALGVDPRDPDQNIMGGARYLRAQLDRFDGDIDLALAAYNAGSGRVTRAGGVPPIPETRAYVARNLDRLAQAAEAQSQGNQP